MSWVTLDRICQERVDKDSVRLEFVRNGSGKKFKKCCGSPAEVRWG